MESLTYQNESQKEFVMTKTMGQTVYDIFGPNIGHSAASQIAALGAYALTDEYMEELKREAESDAEMARLYIEDHKRTQEKEYLEYANQYSKDKSEKLRLIDELMNARLCLLTEHPLYVVYDKMTIFGVDFSISGLANMDACRVSSRCRLA